MNLHHFTKLQDNLSTLRQFAIKGFWDNALATSYNAFNQADYESFTKMDGSTYVCSGNLMWVNIFWSANYGVPVNNSTMKYYEQQLA